MIEIKSFEIIVQDDYDFANELLGTAKSEKKRLETKRKKATDPLNASLKEIRSWYKAAVDFYAEAERILKAKIADAG